jgi:hypothetical protein
MMLLDRKAFVAAGAIVASAAVSHAALTGNAVVTGSPMGGGMYHYTVTLNNTGTTTVGTLWFAWIPGGNFMATVPTGITSPAGWSAQVVGGAGAASILWQANNAGSRLAAGGTLTTFSFNSTSTPAQLSGFAVSSPSNLVTTSFIYSGAAFSDAGFQFTASVVPAPSAAAFASLSLAALARRRTR